MISTTGLPQIIQEAWSGIQTVQRPIKSMVLGCKMAVKKGAYSSVLGLHTMIFQAEI
jgi:hypothetical protein